MQRFFKKSNDMAFKTAAAYAQGVCKLHVISASLHTSPALDAFLVFTYVKGVIVNQRPAAFFCIEESFWLGSVCVYLLQDFGGI